LKIPYPHFSHFILITMFLFSFVWIVPVHAQSLQYMPARSEYGEKSISAYFIQSSITLDGILNEPAWNDAQTASDFFQQEPQEGTEATEETEVKVLYDKENLYIGVMCYDNKPEKIIHNEMRVDGYLGNDDNFILVLDTFNDLHGFYFRINPNGARYDAKIDGSKGGSRGGGRVSGLNSDWNGIWDVSAKITDYGWSAEIVIPLKTLRFPNEEIQNWGINFKREIARKNEEILWTSWRRDDGLFQLSKAGILNDLNNLKRGKKIEFKPFTLAGVKKEAGVIDNNFKYGLDVKYPLTSNLTFDFTTFTDFAQIESDRTMINLTRFDLYYPEKRDFFLEGSEIFKFGSPYTSPFYSRKIGLTPDREQVPILAGAKITGKAGSYNLGILNIQTDEKNDFLQNNFSVVRVKKDILEKSYIGIMATNQYNADENNQSFGIDFAYNTDNFLKNKNLSIAGNLIENKKDELNHGNRSGSLSAEYMNDLFEIAMYHQVIGENYNPDMGFVRRKGIKQYSFDFDYLPRPTISLVKQLRFNPIDLNLYTDMNDKLLTRSISITPICIYTQNDEYFRILLHNSYEFLDEDFNIYDDVVIPKGVYKWWYYQTIFNSNPRNPLSLGFNTQWGDFYNGEKTTLSTGFNYKPNQYFSFSSNVEYNNITIGSRKFDTKEYGMRLNTNFSTKLTSRTYIQWNNEDKILNLNFRIHFIPKIGSDIYFVYNHVLDGYKDYKTIYNTGISKIAYLITF